jgi:hypothetical protein
VADTDKGKTKFLFIDESGVLARDPAQPYFALGLLKIADTSQIYERLIDLRARATSAIQTKGLRRVFEFKFNMVKGGNLHFYKELVDLFFEYPNLQFCCFAIDKRHPKFDLSKHFASHWDAYINFSKLQVRRNCDPDESVVIIADYISKPSASKRYYQRELSKLKRVDNAVLIESNASLFIQLVDVLTGCVIGDLKGVRGNKRILCDYLKSRCSIGSWGKNITLSSPNIFSVWHFTPK